MRLETILCIPDVHVPFHDERAFNLMLKVGRAIKPQTIVILGDFVDFYAVSAHNKDPKRAMEFEEEIEAGKKALRQIKALGAKTNVFIAGNHEDRLWRYLVKQAPELSAIITIPRTLQLQEIGFEYVPYKQSWKKGHMRYTHDVGPSGKHAAAKSMESMGRNTVIGHCHRIEYCVQGTLDGSRHMGLSLGWLGDLNAIEYMARDKVAKDWALGFGVGFYDPKTENTHWQPIPIMPDYSAVCAGVIYQG